MTPVDENAIADLAVTRGMLTPAQLAKATQELKTSDPGTGLLQLLIRRRYLSTTQVASLLEQRKASPVADDRYEITEEIGRGGMATVYRAHDRQLGRDVALKVLREEFASNPSSIARFLREAKAIAGINHTNILRLIDIHQGGGAPYLIVELLEGSTMEDRMQDHRWHLKQRVADLETVARAIQVAHDQGIIHRDLKPGNIMIEKSGRVVVMDFGLAHLASSNSHLTRQGSTLGTPMYMAPEQVRGDQDKITARTDVYALGTILYELLAGKPPFNGKNVAELYHRILNKDAPSIRGPKVPADLETICFKAMNREPRYRYATADALAEDLRRWRDGEPINIHATSRVTRFTREILAPRNRMAGVFAILLLVAVGVAITLAVSMNRTPAATDSAGLDVLRRTTDDCLKEALARRRVADLAGMNAFAVRGEDACKQEMARHPQLAEPYHRWGRLLRALMRFDEAAAQQELALKNQPDFRPARYERGLLRLRQRSKLLEDLKDAWKRKAGRDAAGAAGKVDAQDPTDDDLETEQTAKLRLDAAADLEGDPSAAARGFRALAQLRRDEARNLLEQAFRETPQAEELCESLGRMAEQDKKFVEAESWYTRGLEIDKGYLPFHEQRGRMRSWIAMDEQTAGRDPGPWWEKAISDFENAVKLDPRVAKNYERIGLMHRNWGASRELRGQDPLELFLKAVTSYDQAIRLDPKSALLLTHRAGSYFNITTWRFRKNQPAQDSADLSRRDFDAAIALDPNCGEAWTGRGLLSVNQAQATKVAGGDPVPEFRAGIADFDHAVQLDARNAEAWAQRATSRCSLGIMLMDKAPAEAEAEFEKGLKDADEGVRLMKSHPMTWMTRGQLRSALMLTWSKHGEGASEKFAQAGRLAVEDLKEATRIGPLNGDCWRFLGIMYQQTGQYREALQAFNEAVRVNPMLEGLLRPKITFCQRQLGN